MLRHVSRYLVPLLFLFQSGKAQFATFNHITTDQGLSYNSISCITQDPKGFLWFGTYSGLNKYDGYKITTDLGSDSATKYFDRVVIRALYADTENNLWVSAENEGLTKLDLLTNRITRFTSDSTKKNSSLISNTIHYIKELEKGKIYIATPKGVSILDKNTNAISNLTHDDKNENSLLSNSVRTFAADIYGNIWFGHSGVGLTQYIPAQKKFTRHPMDDPKIKLVGNRIRHLFADSKGILWISLWQGGIAFYDIKSGYCWNPLDSSKKYEPLKGIGLVSEFIEDKNGDIWMCAAEKGIAWYNRKTGKLTCFENNPDDPQTISDNTNLCIMQDRTGLIWSGTWKGGLNYFNPGSLKFGHIKHESNKQSTLNDNYVISFHEVNDREVIIGTGKNICLFDPVTHQFQKTATVKKDEEGLVENSQVNFILKDFDGTFWYCTNGAGACHYFPETKKFKCYSQSGGRGNMPDIPECMVLDEENNIWIGTWAEGLALFDRTTEKCSSFLQDKTSDLFSLTIITMIRDDEGMIWIGTKDNGLLLLEPRSKHFEKVDFGKESILNKAAVGTIAIDQKNRNTLWITCGGHLLEFDRKTKNYIDHSEVSKGLQSEFSGCVQDEKGHLWLTSTRDLFRFNPSTKHYTVYTKADGMQDKEFNPNAILKLSNGKLLMGGISGMNYFDPKDIHDTYSPPVLGFTDLLVLNKPGYISENISYVNELVLEYKDYFFSVQFAAFDFFNPNANQFTYKMEGLDKDWINIGNQHQLTFTNLDPGEYALNIKAANSHGIWNETPLHLKIIIMPPFWRTKWFYALCIIVVVASVYTYIKWREKKLIQEKLILEKKVDERTHELNEEKLKVEEAHKDIKDSINYAQKIQASIIPSEQDFQRHLPNSFVLFQPKDVVSGDFYWIHEKNEHVFCAIADCTGHGVPGGFMTMLGSGLLNETVNEQKLSEPSDILNKLREKIISTLKQTGKAGENKDGMDIVLLRFNKKTRELAYACANNGFLLIENGVMTEYYGDKQPVGIYGYELKPFTAHKIILKENVTLYSYTDGYPDQFGGEKGKKFKYKTLNELLVKNSHLLLSFQKDKLLETFLTWKGNHEQIDDVCVMGIKF
jgi:ligand-binding sensor domain-containing protein/serine phosphatase RsbU (regulator of sigma subunit)